MKKFKPYCILFIVLACPCVFLKPRAITCLVFLSLLTITVIMWVWSYKEAKREGNEEWNKIAQKIEESENLEITQTEVLYNIWKGKV